MAGILRFYVASDLFYIYANPRYQGSGDPKPKRVSAPRNGEARRRDPATLPNGSDSWRSDPRRLWDHVDCKAATDVDRFERLSEGFEPAGAEGARSRAR